MEINKPELSEDGKRNAYNHHCEVVGHMRSYAVCLHLCKSRKEGRLSAIYADCSVAIGKKRCPALSMHAEEKEAGRALYFIERIRIAAESAINEAIKFVSGSTTSKPAPVRFTPLHKSPVTERISTGTYADAINAAMKTEAPAAPVVPLVKVEALPGESPLEMARRLLAQSKQQGEANEPSNRSSNH